MQLFEIHESPRCPSLLRDSLTDFLATSIEIFDSYGPIRQRLMQAIEQSRATRVIDLCSGSGGPWVGWNQSLSNLPPVLLTDKFPNQDAAITNTPNQIAYCLEPVDATSVPAHLTGFRTIFTAVHHFEPETVHQMINDAVAQHQPIGIFEFTYRSHRGLLHMLLSFVAVWLLTPRMRRVTWRKLAFTYLLPVIPLVTTFDGIVSCLRTYRPEEIAEMAKAPGYRWFIGTEPGKPTPVTYAIGIPGDCFQSNEEEPSSATTVRSGVTGH